MTPPTTRFASSPGTSTTGSNPSEQHRENVWSYLRDELRADVALVQESGPPPVDEHHRAGELIGGKRPWGTWVVGFNYPVTAVEQVKGAYSKSSARLSFPTRGTAAVATVEGADLTLVSLYGLQEHGYAHPAVLRHLADLSLLLDDPKHLGRLVVGGDLNLTTQWVGAERPYRAIDGGVLAQFSTFGLTEVVAAHAAGPLEGCGCDDGDACRAPHGIILDTARAVCDSLGAPLAELQGARLQRIP